MAATLARTFKTPCQIRPEPFDLSFALDSNRGQTIGKQVMKLKVVGPDGHSNPTMNESIKRNLWYAFGIVPCIGSLAEIVSIILIAVNINSDPQRQHWFDKFAGGTQVIKIG